MRVAINCMAVNPNYKGGVTTYTLGLLQGFAELDSKLEVRIYCTDTNLDLFRHFENHKNMTVHPYRDLSMPERALRRGALTIGSKKLFKGTSNLLFKSSSQEISKSCDLMYTPTTTFSSFDIPIKTVVSMHDLQQIHFPEFFSKSELSQRNITYGLTAANANYFQSSSDFIREDLLKVFPHLTPEQIVVIHEGVNLKEFASNSTVHSHEVTRKYDLPEKFLFFPAQLWPHKNHITVLKALRKVRDNTGVSIPLVLTGAKFSAAEEILNFCEKNKLDQVRYLGLVPFTDLKALYKAAHFLITAVLYESSSLPVLEAAASGIPIIASDTLPNREIGCNLKLNLFSPLDFEGLANLITLLWSSDLGRDQAVYNQEAVKMYSWMEVAKKYEKFFLNLN